MTTKDRLSSNRFMRPLRCVLFLSAVTLFPESCLAVTHTATKDCSTSPCTVATDHFTLFTTAAIQWQATYTGAPAEPQAFWVGTNSCSCTADIQLSTMQGDLGGSKTLSAGTYYISVKTALMGSGIYSVTFPASVGEPHVTTIDGTRYDFQSAGEFVLLRHPEDLEIQTRQAPVATTFNPGPDPHDGLASCVSINAAVAARVGKRRVTYQPNLSGVPDPSGLQLRVDGALVTDLGPGGLNLGNSGRITNTVAQGGLQIDFPDGTVLFVTPAWWDGIRQWFLNVDVIPARAANGLMGAVPKGSWLPALPDSTSMGPMPRLLHDRFVGLYQKFSDAWRVTNSNSLFDYAPGTSTDTFTNRNWPPEQPPCSLQGTIPVEPASELVAKQACQSVIGDNAHCVFDVRVTGNPAFATTYLLSSLVSNTSNPAKPGVPPFWYILIIAMLLAIIGALLYFRLTQRQA